MSTIEVRTQAALDKALAKAGPDDIIACVGKGSFVVSDSATVRAWGSATVRAWGSATVRAWGSATVEASDSATVEAWDSATVEAWDSATVRAWGSATVRAWGSATVEASDSATVEAWDSATVRASKFVAVHVDRRRPNNATVTGGVIIEIPPLTTAEDWCAYHGVEVVDGIAMLAKAVDDDWSTDHGRRRGIAYAPGSMPVAPDWDPIPECGGGLHFSPSPAYARDMRPVATHFVVCPVRLDEIVVHPDGACPDKVKAPRVVAPGCVEVDIHGRPISGAA